mmetsp:Transcript_49129/g.154229  ORF Transcript_49129/g.154229 Transcript_49129/m.154229 type:complete len:246 (+) Transcript_49129:463-1200(+)
MANLGRWTMPANKRRAELCYDGGVRIVVDGLVRASPASSDRIVNSQGRNDLLLPQVPDDGALRAEHKQFSAVGVELQALDASFDSARSLQHHAWSLLPMIPDGYEVFLLANRKHCRGSVVRASQPGRLVVARLLDVCWARERVLGDTLGIDQVEHRHVPVLRACDGMIKLHHPRICKLHASNFHYSNTFSFPCSNRPKSDGVVDGGSEDVFATAGGGETGRLGDYVEVQERTAMTSQACHNSTVV